VFFFITTALSENHHDLPHDFLKLTPLTLDHNGIF
jgi:hypothetical protein